MNINIILSALKEFLIHMRGEILCGQVTKAKKRQSMDLKEIN